MGWCKTEVIYLLPKTKPKLITTLSRALTKQCQKIASIENCEPKQQLSNLGLQYMKRTLMIPPSSTPYENDTKFEPTTKKDP